MYVSLSLCMSLFCMSLCLSVLVTALNSTPVIFYPTDTSRDSNLVPVLFRVAILHASKYLLNR